MRSLAGFNRIIHQVEKDTAQITAFDIKIFWNQQLE